MAYLNPSNFVHSGKTNLPAARPIRREQDSSACNSAFVGSCGQTSILADDFLLAKLDIVTRFDVIGSSRYQAGAW